jgi:hypothetical protein
MCIQQKKLRTPLVCSMSDYVDSPCRRTRASVKQSKTLMNGSMGMLLN